MQTRPKDVEVMRVPKERSQTNKHPTPNHTQHSIRKLFYKEHFRSHKKKNEQTNLHCFRSEPSRLIDNSFRYWTCRDRRIQTSKIRRI